MIDLSSGSSSLLGVMSHLIVRLRHILDLGCPQTIHTPNIILSILHEKLLYCILATSQEQHAKEADTLKNTHTRLALQSRGKEGIMAFEVFISYAHEDQAFRKELDKHLSNLKRQQLISAWYDGDIMPGTEWQPLIIHHLQTAQIILLLISVDFMASDFCYSIEMTQAMDRHRADKARVI